MSQSQDDKLARQAKAATLKAELQQFTGDLDRFGHPLLGQLIYTPGVQHLAEQAGAYWLIHAIASHIRSDAYDDATRQDPRIDDLHFWRLDVGPDRAAVLTARADSGEPPFIIQAIEFTDFPLEAIDLWCGFDGQRYTLYLPSEH
jgi:hypothetical protein